MVGGLFYFVDCLGGIVEKCCELLLFDEFVKFVDEFGFKKLCKVSKFDFVFEVQIKKSKG